MFEPGTRGPANRLSFGSKIRPGHSSVEFIRRVRRFVQLSRLMDHTQAGIVQSKSPSSSAVPRRDPYRISIKTVSVATEKENMEQCSKLIIGIWCEAWLGRRFRSFWSGSGRYLFLSLYSSTMSLYSWRLRIRMLPYDWQSWFSFRFSNRIVFSIRHT